MGVRSAVRRRALTLTWSYEEPISRAITSLCCRSGNGRTWNVSSRNARWSREILRYVGGRFAGAGPCRGGSAAASRFRFFFAFFFFFLASAAGAAAASIFFGATFRRVEFRRAGAAPEVGVGGGVAGRSGPAGPAGPAGGGLAPSGGFTSICRRVSSQPPALRLVPPQPPCWCPVTEAGWPWGGCRGAGGW